MQPEGIVREIEERNEPLVKESYSAARRFFERNPPRNEVIEWVKARTWFEGFAVSFMSDALSASTKNLIALGHYDIMESLAKQVWDEARHTRYFHNFLRDELKTELGEYKGISALEKNYGKAWEWARSGDLLRLHAGNMLVGEGRVLALIKGMTEGCEAASIYPNLVRVGRLIERDEVFHLNNGRRVVSRYATDPRLQQTAREAADFYLNTNIKSLQKATGGQQLEDK